MTSKAHSPAFPFEKYLALLFLIVFSGVIAVGIATYKSNLAIRNTDSIMQNTSEVLYESEQVYSQTQRLISATNGYIITGDSVFLEIFKTANKEIYQSVSKLENLINDNRAQNLRVDSLKKEIDERIKFSTLAVQLRRNAGFNEASKLIDFGKGKYFTTEIQNLIHNIQKEEKEELKVQQEANLESIASFNRSFFILLSIKTLFLFIIFFVIRYHFRARKRAETDLSFSNKELEQRVEERTAELSKANADLILQDLKIIRSNRLLNFISQINQLIVRVKDEETLFKEACSIAIEVGKFKMVRIGMIDEATKTVIPVMHAGEENGSLSAEALKNIYHSSISLPILQFGKTVGAFSLYSSEVNFFDDSEIALLTEVTGDISFALENFENEALRQKADAQMKRSELQYRRLFEAAKDGILILNAETGVINDVNPFMVQMLGYSHTEFLGKELWEIGLFKDIIANKEAFLKLKEERYIRYNNLPLKTKDGRAIWVEFVSNAYAVNGRQVIQCNIRETTDRKIAEESLLQSEARLKEAQSLAHISNWEIDLVSGVNTWSDEFYNTFRIKREEIKPSPEAFLSLIHPIDFNRVKNKIAKTVETTGESSFKNVRINTSDGSKRYVNGTWRFEFDQNKKPLRLFGILQDITERKLAETEREKITSDLLQRNQDLEQFTYIVSHNLRAPVANIMGISEALRTMTLNETEKDDMMYGLSASTMKLNSVIIDLNNILQTKQTMMEKKESVSFSHLIKNITISIPDQIKEENVEIKTDFSRVDKIMTLKSYLYSIFFNLISNSIKYRQPQLSPVIEINSYLTNEYIEIHYKDNGLGIDLTNQRDKIFGLYKRFHTHKEGKGMGLFMVKTQVETLGGKITIESEINKGTKFIIKFPV